MDNHNGNEDVDDTEAEVEEEEEDNGEDKSEDEVKEGYAHTSSQQGLSKILAKISRPTKRAIRERETRCRSNRREITQARHD